MSADTTPIPPSRFAAAIMDLSPGMLRLKLLEIRNSVAHLQYSNDQLKPFAETETPDQDCVEALCENDVVINRMAQRVALIRAEVERRGLSWSDFNVDDPPPSVHDEHTTAGDNSHGPHPAWSDGTFQAGSLTNGHVRLHDASEATSSHTAEHPTGQDPPAVDERDEPDGGMHL
ncbi:hypothetical protein L249_6776 [Ophiocordyceps polyrhachis-furcata BCC 54312]|uniref:Uncharacterized protein n=1 Tax=Ophiocordyceps polyrhachis-furcata BCC 54312 TaxID=1330021 RepID=A0A367LLW0_9HYPO|nr:hypothetical protein L249_6776 [Ophiocordyceps polyrhachis-furcata BCC 54312]